MNTIVSQNIRQQLFKLNGLSIDQLKLKWAELFKNSPPNFGKKILIKELAYKIQMLTGKSSVSQDEVKISMRLAKKKLVEEKTKKLKQVIIMPPIGSTIRTTYKGKEYIAKVLGEKKFEYDGMIYKSLSAIATDIAGVRWSGYAFFKLKRRIKQ